jgi:hypothetical protein
MAGGWGVMPGIRDLSPVNFGREELTGLECRVPGAFVRIALKRQLGQTWIKGWNRRPCR